MLHRINSFGWWLTSLLLVAAHCGCSQQSPEAVANTAIRSAFYEFSGAVAENDGSTATQHLSSETIAYYERLRDAALRGTPEELRELPIEVRVDVLRLRGRMRADELAALDGRELAAVFVSRRWINSELLSSIRLGIVIHHPRHAEVRFADADGETTQRLVFRPESGAWKFDMAATMGMQRKFLNRLMESRGYTENELIDELLAGLVEGASTAKLWEPLLPAAPGPSQAG